MVFMPYTITDVLASKLLHHRLHDCCRLKNSVFNVLAGSAARLSAEETWLPPLSGSMVPQSSWISLRPRSQYTQLHWVQDYTCTDFKEQFSITKRKRGAPSNSIMSWEFTYAWVSRDLLECFLLSLPYYCVYFVKWSRVVCWYYSCLDW